MIGVQKRKATSGPVQETSARGKQANGKSKSRKRTKLAPSNQGQTNQLNGRPVVHANGARTMLHMDQALATRWSSASGQQQAPATNGSETESVWIFGLINNIEQLLSTFTAANSTSSSSYSSSSSSPSSSSLPTSSSASCSPAGSLQSSANSTPSHHSTSLSAYASPSSSALSSSSSSPSSSSYPPSNGPSNSATSSSSSACSGGAQQATSTITHQPPASQLPRSPISRQIKFHEYKGPPSAKRHNTNNNNNNNNNIINNNNQASITSKAAGEAATVSAASSASMITQAKPNNSRVNGQQVKMADELTGKQQQQQTNVKPNSSTHAHQTTQAQAQNRSSSSSSSSSLAPNAAAQPASLLGPTRQCGAQSMPMGRSALSPSTPAKLNDLATLRQLHNQQEEQVHNFKQANEANPHPSGLLSGGHNQQQQQHMIQQQQRQTMAAIRQQQLTQQLATARQASLSRPVTSAPQAQPASALAAQGFYINQNTLDAPNGPTLLLAPFATSVAAKERQQQMARDEQHYHQRMAMQQQQQITEVALQAQAQQSRELMHCQPEASNSRGADACSSAFMVSMPPRQQPLSRQMANLADYPQQQELPELPGGLDAEGPPAASISTQMEQQNYCDLYHQSGLEHLAAGLEPSSGHEAPTKSHHYSLDGGPPEAAMLQEPSEVDDTLATFGPDSEETEGEIEPSISFGHGVDELLFSEFIDLQDVPMNVDESDWLKKFLPPCSMS